MQVASASIEPLSASPASDRNTGREWGTTAHPLYAGARRDWPARVRAEMFGGGLESAPLLPAASGEGIADGFVLLDGDLRILFANDHACAALSADCKVPGKSPVGQNLAQLATRPVWSSLGAVLADVLATGRARRLRVPEARAGRIWQLKIFPSDQGLALCLRDVAAEQQARGWLKLLEMAVERINDLVIVTDATPLNGNDGPNILYVNEAFAATTGYTIDEITGQVPLFLRSDGHSAEGASPIIRAVAVNREVRGEVQYRTRDGRELWLEVDMVPLHDGKGRLTNWVAIMRDSTDRRRYEERVRQTEKFEAMAKLTGKVAHDFNNLLTVIIGNCEALSEFLENDPGLKHFADLSLNAAERGAGLTARLLDFGKRQQLFPELSDAGRIVETALMRMRGNIPDRITLNAAPGPDLWAVNIDRERFTAGICELIRNASDAIDGAGCVQVGVENQRLDRQHDDLWPDLPNGAYVAITVTDDGPGMSADHAARAVEPFFSTKGKGVATGLGLSGLIGFVRQSGGEARLVSAPGEGTRVMLLVPAQAEVLAKTIAGGQAAPAIAVAEPEPDLTGVRLMLVEDDRMVRDNLRHHLLQRGLVVTTARNADQAFEMLCTGRPPELLLSDVVMDGEMDGLALAQVARRWVPDLKILLMSGFTDHAIDSSGDVDRGLAFIAKPYRIDALVRKLGELR